MPKTDLDPLGDRFKWRLRAELDRITPRYSSPRYLSRARGRLGAWRFAPAGLAAGIVAMLGLTAYAATGSPNPVVWTQQLVTRIEPNAAESSPSVHATSTPEQTEPAASPSQHEAEPSSRPGPAESPEPTGSPEPRESPDPPHGGQSGSPGDR